MILTSKYSIGDVVYAARTVQTTGQHPCPDCLGTQKWKITTPAGTELEMGCERCQRTYQHREIPPLTYELHKPVVMCLTIGSIRIDTHVHVGWDNEHVNYMCQETSVGSGSTYRESRLYATREEAQAVAELQAAGKNTAVWDQPEAIAVKRLAELQFNPAIIEQARSSIWNAWYSYRRLKEEIAEILQDDNHKIDDEVREKLEETLKWEAEQRDLPPLGQVLYAARRAVAGDTAPLAKAISQFPEIFDEPPKEAGTDSL